MNIITKSDTSRRRIAAVGMYDGVHLGHRFLIDYLKLEAAGRRLTPSVITFSRHPLSLVRPLEAPALLMSLEERLRMIDEAGAEDIILLAFNDRLRYKSARDFLSMLKKSYAIDALVLGFNNHFGHDRPGAVDDYRRLGAETGVEVISAPEYRGAGAPVSSSAIRRYLHDGEPAKAAAALGHNFTIHGIVCPGERLGRRLGFPTANITPACKDVLLPKPGAYAAIVVTPDGVRRKAMVNIGFRPTVSADNVEGKLSVEAHIFDYTGYLYDEMIAIEFVEYLRGERRFDTVDKLRSQLETDAAKARKILA